MFLYFAYITDYAGTPVLALEFTATAKHSAFLATQFLKSCPNAGGFTIRKRPIDAREVAKLLNKEWGS